MRFEDGDFVLEAAAWEDFRAQLRDRYPDERFERRIHVQRDREAEVRRERAINSLAQIIADAVVDEWLREHGIRPEADTPLLHFNTAP